MGRSGWAGSAGGGGCTGGGGGGASAAGCEMRRTQGESSVESRASLKPRACLPPPRLTRNSPRHRPRMTGMPQPAGVLREIVEHKREEVARAKAATPLSELEAMVAQADPPRN